MCVLTFTNETHRHCGVLVKCMYSGLVGGLPFVARAAWLACRDVFTLLRLFVTHMCRGLAGGLPFVARAAWLACRDVITLLRLFVTHMCHGLAGGLPFVARVALLACVGGLAFVVCVCLWWFLL